LNEIITTIKDNLTLILAFLTLIAGIIDNSKKIAAKPLTGFFKWLGNKLNAEVIESVEEVKKQQGEIKERQLSQEASSLNEFYQRHINGENLTREQYELAIDMFEKHLAVPANSVNKLHLEVLKNYYMSQKWDE
jgi:hypothetical protein